MKFVNFAKYEDLNRVASARTAHFAYADRLRARGELAVGGPLLDGDGQRIGLLFIYEAPSRDVALGFVRDDPFTSAKALSRYVVTEWRLRGANVGLLAKANRSADHTGGAPPQVRLFANYTKYSGDVSRLEHVRPAHWQYDHALKRDGKQALAGPCADNSGGLFVYSATSAGEAISHANNDPFVLEGVVAGSELHEWLIEGVNTDLLTSDFPPGKQDLPVDSTG